MRRATPAELPRRVQGTGQTPELDQAPLQPVRSQAALELEPTVQGATALREALVLAMEKRWVAEPALLPDPALVEALPA